MPDVTGRPGYWTMEMNGGSSAPHLACTPCVPLFVHCLKRVEAEGLLDYQGRAGIISSIVRFGIEKSRKNVRNPSHHYFSKKYRNTPPICIAIRLQFVLQYFWYP